MPPRVLTPDAEQAVEDAGEEEDECQEVAEELEVAVKHVQLRITSYEVRGGNFCLSEQRKLRSFAAAPERGQDFDERPRSFTGSRQTTDFTDESSGEDFMHCCETSPRLGRVQRLHLPDKLSFVVF